ncbi:hypothetical protein GCM10008927_10820 [Amylibacter ulvae]|uniref:Oxidoreductase n=1 Tax=Paramylibacter ulvae TaxID=1651968 RepID=A0ABQ3CXY5_9RHOB|nr:Gfo/Idh/MocA family oxidoreductase [Amylibacter ulvae]GHA47728.1 hypothetical protein GCM10008927_10820 [Amylibacter ulvae]
MTKIGLVGLGKMGISHFSIANADPRAEIIICDASGYMLDTIKKYTGCTAYKSFDTMLEKEDLAAVIIATPSRLHAPMVRAALEKGLHVFCEKPFCLDPAESAALAKLAADKGLITQVGYHYRYVGAFQEMKRIIDSGAIGTVTHILAEAYGPVILKPKGKTWRTDRAEGGGCLYDYAAHPINLLNWYFGEPDRADGTILAPIFSADTDDEVYSTLTWNDGTSAHVSVNWSDESYRKMSTKISITGTKGRINADRQECQTYLRETNDTLPEYEQGWNVRYTTDLTQEVAFYLRGEEYSAQMYDFISAVVGDGGNPVNDFASATQTDRTMAMMITDHQSAPTTKRAAPLVAKKKRSWLGR